MLERVNEKEEPATRARRLQRTAAWASNRAAQRLQTPHFYDAAARHGPLDKQTHQTTKHSCSTPAPVKLRVVLPAAAATAADAGSAFLARSPAPYSVYAGVAQTEDGHRAGYPLSPLSKSRRAARERVAGNFLLALAKQDPSLQHLIAAKTVITDALTEKRERERE